MSVLHIGESALRTAYTRLQTTSHNIANASTPGYSRQEAEVASLGAQFGPGGFVGGGVDVQTIARRYDSHLAREVNSATATMSSDSARAESLSRLDRLFSDSENGLGSHYDSFNASLADMVNQPFDRAARTVAMQRSQELASSISSTDGELDRIGNDTDMQATQLVSQLNDRLVELASLNERIAFSAGSRHAPNDLMDQRDAAIESINAILQTDAHINEDNTVSLFAVSGHALVLADDPATVALQGEPGDPERLQLSIQTQGQPVPLSQDKLGGGELAGLLVFRNDDIDEARARLGQIAGGLASSYNAQQAMGLDADGNPGGDLFRISEARTLAATTNTGNAEFSVAIEDGQALQASDYTLKRDAGQYVLTRDSDDAQFTLAALPASIDGLSISLDSGAMADQDEIVLKTSSAFSSGFESTITTPDQWANAWPALPILGGDNTGDVTVTDFNVTQADVNLSETVTMIFSAGGNIVVNGTGTGNPTALPWQPGEPISFNGWELTLAGEPQAGDTLTIKPPDDPLADNRNARALLELSEGEVVAGGSPSHAIGSLIGEIGGRSLLAANNARQSETWHQGALATRDAVSGVNLDEEAARLLQYQQAYQAAAKVIATSQAMFDSLMAASR